MVTQAKLILTSSINYHFLFSTFMAHGASKFRGSTCSWVSLEGALPGVVVGVVVPLSVSVGDAFQLLVSNVVVGISVRSASVDSLFSGHEGGWLVH